MKRIIILIYTILSCCVSINAQDTIAVEDIPSPIPVNVTQIADLNNVLTPFIGEWKYETPLRKYVLKIEKINHYRNFETRNNLMEERLFIRYEIRNANKNILKSTMVTPFTENALGEGEIWMGLGIVSSTNTDGLGYTYRFLYPSLNYYCGYKTRLILNVNTNGRLSFFVSLLYESSIGDLCEGPVEELFPMNQEIIFEKVVIENEVINSKIKTDRSSLSQTVITVI